jgi:hypothetical protein
MSKELRNSVQRATIEHRRGYLTAENLPTTVGRFKRENEPLTFNVGTSLAETSARSYIESGWRWQRTSVLGRFDWDCLHAKKIRFASGSRVFAIARRD